MGPDLSEQPAGYGLSDQILRHPAVHHQLERIAGSAARLTRSACAGVCLGDAGADAVTWSASGADDPAARQVVRTLAARVVAGGRRVALDEVPCQLDDAGMAPEEAAPAFAFAGMPFGMGTGGSDVVDAGAGAGCLWVLDAAGRRYEDGALDVLDELAALVGWTVGEEIAALVASEQELRESERRLMLALRVGDMGTWEMEMKSGRLHLSPDLAHMYGLEPDALDGSTEQVLARVHPDDRAGLIVSGTHAFSRGESYRNRHRAVLPGGQIRWIESFAHVMVDAVGHPVCVTGISMDVTQRMEMTDRVWTGDTYYRALVENASDVVAVLEVDGAVRYLSGGYARLIGLPPAELVELDPLEVIHAEDEGAVRAAFAEVVGVAGARRELQARLLRRGGEAAVVRLVMTNMVDIPEIAGVVVNVQDLTERAALEVQLRHAQKMEAVGRMAAAAAHDFNNVLTVIQACGSFVEQDCAAAAEDARQILKAAEDGARLTRQLLQFSRQQVVRPQVLEPAVALREMQGMLRRVLSEDVDFRVSMAPKPGRVKLDPGHLQQVVMNLVLNAGDALQGAGCVEVRLQSTTVRQPLQGPGDQVLPGRYVELSVSDTGEGIAPEVLPQIFDPFFTTKRSRGGTGLGLSTVYGIVKQHGGSILVDSTPGKGTTVRVFLPRERLPVAAVEQTRPAQAAGDGQTVLLVEDDATVRALLARMVGRAGYRVRQAGDAAEALREAAALGPLHVLLLDVVLPDLSGPELALRIQRIRPGVPAVFMSGYTADEVIQRGVREGVADYLEKPFDMQALGRVLGSAIGSARPASAEDPAV